MAEQMRPSSKKNAPDPSTHFDRSRPENEAGMGRMDSEKPRAAKSRDKMDQGVTNKQDPTRQINAEDIENLKSDGRLSSPDHITHGKKDKEPAPKTAPPKTRR